MNEAAQSRLPTHTPSQDAPGRVTGFRARLRSVPGGALAWRVAITVVGLATIAGGVLLLPLPGPGWLIIFAGLGLLATEYAWAARLLRRARRFVTWWTHWAASRGPWVRVALGLLALLLLAGAVLASLLLFILI